MASKKPTESEPVLARNRAALHDYHIVESWEAGIVLTGTEVKSLRAGQANLKDAYAKVSDGELWLYNAHISPYSQGNRENPDPLRARKLLVHAREIRKLEKETVLAGMTLVPLRLYLKNGRVKAEIALARGKNAPDKREAIRDKDLKREADRERGARSVR